MAVSLKQNGTPQNPPLPSNGRIALRRPQTPKPFHLVLQAEFQLLQPNLFQLFRVAQKHLGAQRVQSAIVQAVFLHELLN